MFTTFTIVPYSYVFWWLFSRHCPLDVSDRTVVGFKWFICKLLISTWRGSAVRMSEANVNIERCRLY